LHSQEYLESNEKGKETIERGDEEVPSTKETAPASLVFFTPRMKRGKGDEMYPGGGSTSLLLASNS